jgi:hypothetical protein
MDRAKSLRILQEESTRIGTIPEAPERRSLTERT